MSPAFQIGAAFVGCLALGFGAMAVVRAIWQAIFPPDDYPSQTEIAAIGNTPFASQTPFPAVLTGGRIPSWAALAPSAPPLSALQQAQLAQQSYGLANQAGPSNALGSLNAHQAQIAGILRMSSMPQSQVQVILNQMQSTRFSRPDEEPTLDPEMASTMGWRFWYWTPVDRLLMSPLQMTLWRDGELHCETWEEAEVVRGVAGIHARLVPLDWTKAASSEVPKGRGWGKHGDPSSFATPIVTGLVERFGRYVLGNEGWRAEHVVIRKLLAPSTDIGLALEAAYPDVEIIYEDR